MMKLKSRSSLLHGRRTGVNIISGKRIRKQGDGTDVFEDYWTDTEESISLTGSPSKKSKKTSKTFHISNSRNDNNNSVNNSKVDNHISERRSSIQSSKQKNHDNSLTNTSKSTSPVIKRRKWGSADKNIRGTTVNNKSGQNHQKTQTTPNLNVVSGILDPLKHNDSGHLQEIDSGVKSFTSNILYQGQTDCFENNASALQSDKHFETVQNCNPDVSSVPDVNDMHYGSQLVNSNSKGKKNISFNTPKGNKINKIIKNINKKHAANDHYTQEASHEIMDSSNSTVSSVPDVNDMHYGSQLVNSNSKGKKNISFDTPKKSKVNKFTKNINNKHAKNDQNTQEASHEIMNSSNSSVKKQKNVSFKILEMKENELIKESSVMQTEVNSNMEEDLHDSIPSDDFTEEEVREEPIRSPRRSKSIRSPRHSKITVNDHLPHTVLHSVESKTASSRNNSKQLCNETHARSTQRSAFSKNASSRKDLPSFVEESVNTSESISSSKGSNFKNKSSNNKSKILANETHVISAPTILKDAGNNEEITSINVARNLFKSKKTPIKSIENNQTKKNAAQHNQSENTSPYIKENSRKRNLSTTENEVFVKDKRSSLRNKQSSSQNNLTEPKIAPKKKKKDKIHLSSVTNGVRRSSRQRFPILASWRNQRPRYRITESGSLTFLGIDEGTKEDNKAVKQIEEVKKKNVKKKSVKKDKNIYEIAIKNLETGDETYAKLVKPFPSLPWVDAGKDKDGKHTYSIAKTFDSKPISFGYIDIHPFKEKSMQYLPNDDLHFTIIKGEIQVQMHETKFVASKMTSFIVPHGTAYSLSNISNKNALVAFTVFKLHHLQAED